MISPTTWGDPDYGLGMYARLPGTVTEADAIVRHFSGVQTLSRGQATKAALARIAGPAVLHVATHGFYNRASGPALAATSTTTVAQQQPVATADRGMSIESALAAPPPGSPNDDPADALIGPGWRSRARTCGPTGS